VGVGTDDGQYYADEREYHADSFQSRFGGAEERPLVYIGTPPGSPAEATGALKSDGGTNPPEKVPQQDYDYGSWQAANPGVEMAPGQHYPDTYKLPNHMTFSDESIYHGVNGAQGGHWGTDENGADTFTPGVTNLQQHSMGELKDYFAKVEPNAKLLPPDIDDVMKAMDITQQANQPKPNTVATAHTTTGRNIDITDQDIDKNMGLAMAFSGGGLTFGGVGAKAIDKMALYKAHTMEMNGVHPDDIFHDTGWFRAADNRWKFEIPDQGAKIKDEVLSPTMYAGEHLKDLSGKPRYELSEPKLEVNGANEMGDLHPHTLEHVLDHPELFKAYPELKGVEVKPVGPFDRMAGVKGYFNHVTNTLALSPASKEDMLSTALHEVQHAIQAREGFSKGASPQMFETPRWKDLSKEFNKMKNTAEKKALEGVKGSFTDMWDMKRAIENEPKIPEWENRDASGWSSTWSKQELQNAKENIAKAKELGVYDDFKKIIRGEQLANQYYELTHAKYESVKGEVEARNVQNRMAYKDRERRMVAPRSSQSHRNEDQLWSPLDPASLTDFP
jgi:hypothetical protein